MKEDDFSDLKSDVKRKVKIFQMCFVKHPLAKSDSNKKS